MNGGVWWGDWWHVKKHINMCQKDHFRRTYISFLNHTIFWVPKQASVKNFQCFLLYTDSFFVAINYCWDTHLTLAWKEISLTSATISLLKQNPSNILLSYTIHLISIFCFLSLLDWNSILKVHYCPANHYIERHFLLFFSEILFIVSTFFLV